METSRHFALSRIAQTQSIQFERTHLLMICFERIETFGCCNEKKKNLGRKDYLASFHQNFQIVHLTMLFVSYVSIFQFNTTQPAVVLITLGSQYQKHFHSQVVNCSSRAQPEKKKNISGKNLAYNVAQLLQVKQPSNIR